MRVTQHHIISRLKSRTVSVGGALFMALMVSGCSAVNMTGFSFPVFGLTKKSADQNDASGASSNPAGQNQTERLANQ